MNKIRMGHVDELPVGSTLTKRVMARRLMVVNDNGRLFGIDGDCRHMKASLADGTIKDGFLTCKKHNWKYDLNNGDCERDNQLPLKTYRVELINDEIYLFL